MNIIEDSALVSRLHDDDIGAFDILYPNHRIFPIPTSQLQLNPKLRQNPGY